MAVKAGALVVGDFRRRQDPEPSDAPEAAEIVSVAPRLEASVTVLPETGFEFASFKVTVIVEVVLPSATTEAGLELTVD